MIRSLYDEFIAHHCGHLRHDDVDRLTGALCAYLARAIRAAHLMRVAKKLEVDREFREFRRRIDGNPYASSRLWRACWTTINGQPNRALQRYDVEAEDVEWVLASMPVSHLMRIEEAAAGEWIERPDYLAIQREVMSMEPYCKRYVKKLKFIAKYDPAMTLTDFEHDMLAAGLAAAYRSDHRTTDLTWLRNIAWRSATNYAVSIIKHHTTKARQRIERQQRVVAVETEVKVYRRTMCMACAQPSQTALCSDCAASPTKRAPEDHGTFIATRSASSKIKAGPHRCDDFHSTTSFLSTPLRTKDGLTLMDVAANSEVDTCAINASTADLVHDLSGQPIEVQRVCAIILGGSDAAFDAWLRERHGQNAGFLRDRRLTAEACEYYGVTRRRLQRAMAPILGVEAHA
jgi:hypothetical protein